MEPERQSYPSNNTELNLFVGKILLAFAKKSRDLTRNKSQATKNNLSIRVLTFLSMQPNSYKQNIIDALRSNHTTITHAIKNLVSDGFLIQDIESEYDTRLKVSHKVTRFRLSLAGECYISAFMADVVKIAKV